MRSPRRLPGLLAAAVLVLAACGDDTVEPAARDDAGPDTTVRPDDPDSEPADEPIPVDVEMVDGDWIVVEITRDGEPVALLDDWPITVSIDGDEIGGTAACNGFGGTVEVASIGGGGVFRVGELAQTEMACMDDGVMDLESAFLAALGRIDSYELSGGLGPDAADDEELSLAVADGSTTIRLTRQEPVEDAELTGTRWVLDTLIDGDVASSGPDHDEVVVELADDGTWTGTTGCRSFTGEWLLAGSVLEVPTLTMSGDTAACPDPAVELDARVVAVLESGSTVDVDGDRLTITASGGAGLSFRAADVP